MSDLYETLADLGRVGPYRARLVRNGDRAVKLDLREYVQSPSFTGWTQRGIRLDIQAVLGLQALVADAVARLQTPAAQKRQDAPRSAPQAPPQAHQVPPAAPSPRTAPPSPRTVASRPGRAHLDAPLPPALAALRDAARQGQAISPEALQAALARPQAVQPQPQAPDKGGSEFGIDPEVKAFVSRHGAAVLVDGIIEESTRRTA